MTHDHACLVCGSARVVVGGPIDLSANPWVWGCHFHADLVGGVLRDMQAFQDWLAARRSPGAVAQRPPWRTL